ncbi:MAG: methylmalonyl Co-A mutase-associated GTPase MeaB [Acidobacteriota bacterium]
MQDWAERILAGDPRALARAATAVENGRPEAAALLGELAPHTGRATLIGITGAPGTGKSTLADQLARALRRQGRTVGIVAVDPSSPYTGGAILGDRIRMQDHHGDAGVFIRSMASRGAPGGLAAATAAVALLFDAAGRQDVLIETVGVGQDQVEVAWLADVTVLVLAPGMGDEVQTLKAGLMEIADIFVINKADHAGADRLERELQQAADLVRHRSEWRPPVLRTVATEGQGVEELLAAIRGFEQAGPVSERRARRRERIAAAPAGYRIDHFGIAVRSLDEALEFWEGRLGMRVSGREPVPGEKVNVAMLPAGGPRLELLEPTAPDSVIARFLEKRGPGLHHVALSVPDLEAAMARLTAAGARVLGEPRRGAGGRVYVFVHPASTGGVLLELVQEQTG